MLITIDGVTPSFLVLTALWGVDEAILSVQCCDGGSEGPGWGRSEKMASKLRLKGQTNQPGGFGRRSPHRQFVLITERHSVTRTCLNKLRNKTMCMDFGGAWGGETCSERRQ